MDAKGGCCIARYAGGAYDMSKVDRIMLRFRPIAPKTAISASVSGGSTPENNEVCVRSGRGKRRYVKQSNNKRCYKRKRKAASADEAEPLNKTTSGGSISGGETVVTLSLLPETPDRKETPASLSDLSGAKKRRVENVPIWSSVGLDRTAVRVVGSMVTVECVTADTWVEEYGLGSTDEERRRNLEEDTCPGFISDGQNRVGWTNGAYREMVEEEEEVWLVMKERVPVTDQAFTCRVRVVQYSGGKEKSSLTLPCDVWRMDGGGFAWKLDVKAALCLGR